VSTRSKQVALVVDTREQVLDLDILANDIAAVEFAIGRPLWIPFLVGVDENGTAQGAGDLSARQVHADQPRCPVPTLRRNGTWPAVLAARVAFKLLEDPREDAPLAIGTAAYMDSLSGHVHARYLLAQVALEAFAGALVDSPAHLVADLSAWRRFVNEHEASIKLLARDRESAEQLIRNLSNNVFRAPSGRRVANALRELELEVPIELLEEVARRGSAAHNFVMYKGEVDIQVLADRIARVQTLLVALIAKHVGYEGPIIGWELENGSWSVPSWWPDGDHAEAHLRFLAQGDSDT
jgi:hypothetical protein